MSSQSQETTDKPCDADDEYSIRWYRSGDADGVLSLFEDELGRTLSRAYFDWKYVDDPYLSHVPINVVESEGDLVGVQAYVPCQLRSGDRTVLGLQPVDAVVHSNHRRNGLYTRMTRQAVERYEDGEAALFFNYPTQGALGAQEKLGWESLGELDVHYRIQQPSGFVESAIDGGGGRTLGRLADALARGAFDAIDRVAPAAENLQVRDHDSVPAATLESLYELSVPDRLHVHREGRFYEWWLDDPTRDYTTYVALSNGEPVAALVTRTTSGVLQLREALPLPPEQPTPALGRLLSKALADNPDAEIVKSVGETLPGELLRRFGFVRDSAPVLDGQTKPLRMAARALTAGDTDDEFEEPLPVAITERANWLPTFLEPDKD